MSSFSIGFKKKRETPPSPNRNVAQVGFFKKPNALVPEPILPSKIFYAVGSNNSGQLGLGNTLSPVTVFTEIPGNYDEIQGTNAVTFGFANNRLSACGANLGGLLGPFFPNGDTSIFTDVGNITFEQFDCGVSKFIGLSGQKIISVGSNFSGELGIGSNNAFTSFRQESLSGRWDKVSTGQRHTMALSGTKLYATGNNSFGQLGLGNFTSFNVFQPLTGDWNDVICCNDFTFAISGNSVFAAGRAPNDLLFGPNFAPFISGNDRISKIVASLSHVFFLSAGTTNKWLCYGSNNSGQLGNSLPVFPMFANVNPLTGSWDKIVCGSSYTLALSGNKVFGAGSNSSGQLGLPNFGVYPTFTEITSPTGNWVDIFATRTGTSSFICGLV